MKHLIFFLLVVPGWVTAQITFEKTYGSVEADFSYSVQQTTDGGYIVVGVTEYFGGGPDDVYMVKTDSVGDTLWTRAYGGIGIDKGRFVEQTTDGGYVIVGSTQSFGAGGYDVYLIKTDSVGSVEWAKPFGGVFDDQGYSVQQTADGGYVVVGATQSFGAGGNDVYLIKVDVFGNASWSNTFGGLVSDYGMSVQQTVDGGYVIAGGTYNFGAGGSDVYLIKTDGSGNLSWSKTFGGISNDGSNFVQQTSDSGYVIVGYTLSFGSGGSDVYLVKTDGSGNLSWSKTFGGISSEYGLFGGQASDSGYVVVGVTSSFGAGGDDVYLVKVDSVGNGLWSQTYGGIGTDYGRCVQQVSDGGYVIAGYTTSFGAGGSDVYLIKTDSIGGVNLPVGVAPGQSLIMAGVEPYPLSAKPFYYDLVGRALPSPGVLAPGQLYITAVYSSTGHLLGRKLQLAP